MNGEHQPPGLCQFGEEVGKEVFCRKEGMVDCEFMFWTDINGPTRCGREAAALAIAEQDQGVGE